MQVIQISADLILHSRGNNVAEDSLIAVEMKKSGRPTKEKHADRNRLRAMTKGSYDGIWSNDRTTHPEHVCGYRLGVMWRSTERPERPDLNTLPSGSEFESVQSHTNAVSGLRHPRKEVAAVADVVDVVASWWGVAVICVIVAYVAIRVEWGRLTGLFDPQNLERRRRARWSILILPWATYVTTVIVTATVLLFFGDQLASACVQSDVLAEHCSPAEMLQSVLRDGLVAAIGSTVSALLLGLALIRFLFYYALGYGIPICTGAEAIEHFWHNLVHSSDLLWLQIANAAGLVVATVIAAVTGQGLTHFISGRICR